LQSWKNKVLVAFAILGCVGYAHADLEQVSTSFGAQTALLDSSSGLEWLHLNLTAGYSYDAMQAQLASGGTFDGWHYATSDELTRFFIDYTGSPNGIVTGDDALSLQFMNDLGGPLFVITNPANGFHRESSAAYLDVPFDLGHAIYGYIAIDNFAGATITPALQGSSIDTFGSGSYGHWLVEDVPVPEPSTLSVLIPGLAFVVFRLKRTATREFHSVE
jgi:hypothetical protein